MSFFVEIKRRKVFQAAAIYGVVAWLLVQIVTAIEAPLNLPDWADTLVIVLLGIGFPIVLIMSWVFNLTPDGLVRDDGDSSSSQSRGPRIEYALIVLLAVAVAYLLIDDYVLDKDRGEPTAAAANVTERPSSTSPPAPEAPSIHRSQFDGRQRKRD